MMAAAAVPHPPVPLARLACWGLCSLHRVCMGCRGCPPLFPPPHCGGEEGIAAPLWLWLVHPP